jgi:hypothetical protein
VGAGGYLLGKIWLEREAEFLSVFSAEFKNTWNYAPIFPIHLYAVNSDGRNASSKNNIVIRFVITFIL